MPRTTTRPALRAVPTIVRRAIRARLEAAPGFQELAADQQRGLVADIATLTAFSDHVAAVDFPSFVGGLLKGVFDAIAGTSIRQMEAYAALVQAVAKSVDRFVTDPAQRSELAGALGDMFELCPDGTLALRGRCPKRRAPRGRAAGVTRPGLVPARPSPRTAARRARRR